MQACGEHNNILFNEFNKFGNLYLIFYLSHTKNKDRLGQKKNHFHV
jgi:hypothetical protein